MATRDRLLEAAAEVFSEKGYEGARVGEIARRAGLTTGAIYAQFKNKADLLQETIARWGSEGVDLFLMGSTQGGTAAELLTDMGVGLLTDPPEDWVEGLLLEAMASARRDPELATHIRGAFQEQERLLRDFFDFAKGKGEFDRQVDAAAAARFATALSLGMLLLGSIGLATPEPGAWKALISRQVGAVINKEDH
jgi:AcrR family transcriptional regulator